MVPQDRISDFFGFGQAFGIFFLKTAIKILYYIEKFKEKLLEYITSFSGDNFPFSKALHVENRLLLYDTLILGQVNKFHKDIALV